MSNKLAKLNVFGDSFSTPGYCVMPQDSFWGLMYQDLQLRAVKNYSHVGFSLDHIVHILLNETFDFDRDYFVIGIPPLIRYVSYNDNYEIVWNYTCFDLAFTETLQEIESLQKTDRFSFDKQFTNRNEIDRFNAEWNDVQSLEKIFLIHQYLQSKQAKFMIVNLTTPLVYQDLWPAGKGIMVKTKQLKECILFDNTYQSTNYNDQIKPVDFNQYGWQGHHGAEGNRNWYDKVIKPKIIELNWIEHA